MLWRLGHLTLVGDIAAIVVVMFPKSGFASGLAIHGEERCLV